MNMFTLISANLFEPDSEAVGKSILLHGDLSLCWGETSCGPGNVFQKQRDETSGT